MTFHLSGLLVLASVFALDFLYARYTTAVTSQRRPVAGMYAAGIIVLSGYAAINYVNDPWMLVPAAIGAFFGTIAGMKQSPPSDC